MKGKRTNRKSSDEKIEVKEVVKKEEVIKVDSTTLINIITTYMNALVLVIAIPSVIIIRTIIPSIIVLIYYYSSTQIPLQV
jgi:hypothetical protein